jgi:hypothetical protein
MRRGEVTHEQLLNEIKNNYNMAIITLEDMTKLIYTKNKKINSNELDKLEYLGLFGIAYKYENNKIRRLEWIKGSSTYSVIEKEEEKEDDNTDIILHYTLIKDKKEYSKLSLKEVLKDE